MTRARYAAAAAAALCLASRAGAQLNSWEGGGGAGDTPVAAFLRAHGTLVIYAVPVIMGVIYILIMGPADVADALRRTSHQRRGGLFGYKGFGSSGGFGGDPITRKNPWQ